MSQRKSVALAAVQAVENVSQYLRVPRLHSIRSRILALAVVGTVLPAGISLGVAYSQNRRARSEKITQELMSESSQTARAMGVWLKERLYDLRVFAGSSEVANNLTGAQNRASAAAPAKPTAKTPAKTAAKPAPKATDRPATVASAGGRLREYLRSLHERFPDFDQLMVLGPDGRLLATSSPDKTPIPLPHDWQKTLRQQNQLIGEAFWDTTSKKGKLIVAVPVQRTDGQLLGAFAAELTLEPIKNQLGAYVPNSNHILFLTTTDGALVASSREVSPALLQSRLGPGVMQRLTEGDAKAVTYHGAGGREVVGTIKRVPQVPWAVLSEVSAEAAFHDVRQFRNVALLVVVVLLVIVGASAYYLGIIIVRPLERLAKAAAEVSLGDLDVDLPNTGGGEVAVLTGVFNQMVKTLREGREELERLSVTDGLTGLTNHRALMQRLNEEAMRATRSKRSFAVIMTDVDHFKSYNDTFGHPAGDEVLRRVAALLKESTRTVDCVARYGGEEFAILLPETEIDGALEVAERIRTRIETERFPERAVTVSIGVAEFPTDADRPEKIIAVADAALYEAKHAGRNRVMRGSRLAPAKPRKGGGEKEVLPLAQRPEKAKKKG